MPFARRQAELNLRQKRLLALHGGFGDVDDEVANLFELADEVDVIEEALRELCFQHAAVGIAHAEDGEVGLWTGTENS